MTLQASPTWTKQVAQVQEPPHSATMLATPLRNPISITVEPISAWARMDGTIMFNEGNLPAWELCHAQLFIRR